MIYPESCGFIAWGRVVSVASDVVIDIYSNWGKLSCSIHSIVIRLFVAVPYAQSSFVVTVSLTVFGSVKF